MVGWPHRLNRHEFEQTWEMVKDREAWRAAVHVLAKSWTRLSDGTTTCDSVLVNAVSMKFMSYLVPLNSNTKFHYFILIHCNIILEYKNEIYTLCDNPLCSLNFS